MKLKQRSEICAAEGNRKVLQSVFFLGTFTGLRLKDLMRAAALIFHDLNDHSSGAGLATGGLKAPPLQAGQLARTPR